MRRFPVFAPFAALLVSGLSAPSPAGAAVAVYTYQITGGFSSGTLNVGNINGGEFSVRFTNAPNCGPSAGTCPATLLSGTVMGTAGTATFAPTTLSQLVQNTGFHFGSGATVGAG